MQVLHGGEAHAVSSRDDSLWLSRMQKDVKVSAGEETDGRQLADKSERQCRGERKRKR